MIKKIMDYINCKGWRIVLCEIVTIWLLIIWGFSALGIGHYGESTLSVLPRYMKMAFFILIGLTQLGLIGLICRYILKDKNK